MIEVKRLKRLDDGRSFCGTISYIIFDANGRGKELSEVPLEGAACIVGLEDFPIHQWQTTEIDKVISDTEFLTKNSHYKVLDL